jgi:hypothetical protein
MGKVMGSDDECWNHLNFANYKKAHEKCVCVII